jgi:tripartite-type tricarboxylate transporter receptor subunit TctC
MAQWLSERLGQTFVVENRSGASGNLAAEAVVRAQPDGYTLLLASASNAINATLYDNLNFSFIRDIAPVAGVVSFPMVITVHSSFPTKTLPEFLASAKATPGKINIGTPGVGSPQHVAGELFKKTRPWRSSIGSITRSIPDLLTPRLKRGLSILAALCFHARPPSSVNISPTRLRSGLR